MGKYMKHPIYSFLILFIFVFSARSQYFPEKLFTVDDGLPQSIITTIVKDAYGYLWIGTNEGMARFNGKNFKNYTQSNGYPFHLISGIVEKEPGVLWVSDYGFGLFELKNNSARHIVFDPALKDFHVNFLTKEKDGRILLGSDPGGLYIFKNGLLIKHYSDASEIPGGILCASVTADGAIWIGTFSNGAVLLKDGKVIRTLTKKDGLPSAEVRSILPRKNGTVWFGTGNGLYILNDSRTAERFNNKYPNSQIMSVYAADSVNIYLNISSQMGGVVHFKGNALADEIEVDKSIYTKCTYMDESGIIFIGTYDGLLMLPDRHFVNYDMRSGLKDVYIRAIAKDAQGRLWAGTKNDGVFYLKNDRFHPFPLRRFDERFQSPNAFFFENNQFWIGTRRGLLILENNKPLQNAVTQVCDSLEIRKILKIDSAVYVVTRKKLFKYREGKVTDLTFNFSDSVNSIWGVEKDKYGTLWAATNGWGIWRLKDTVWVSFKSAENPKYLYGVRKVPSGDLLFPGSVGAFLLKDSALINLYPDKGNVWDAISTRKNDYWFGTSRGLVHKFDQNVEYYSRKNGYASTEFNIGSFLIDADQSLWFGGVTGLMHYTGGHNHRAETMPLVINSLQAGDSIFFFPTRRQKEIHLRTKNININYNLVSFKMPSEIRYRIFLEGFDADTSDFTSETHINYTNLNAGAYTFHVFAYFGGDTKYYKTKAFSFEIASAWWETWWAIGVYAFLLLLFVYLFTHGREKYLIRKNALLEQKIEERMTELRASNQRLLTEIKERSRAEHALGEEKEQLAVTLASITDGVIRLDEAGHVVLMNAVAQQMCGLLQNEAKGRALSEILHIKSEKDGASIELNVKNIKFSEKNSIYSQYALLKNNRNEKPIHIYLSVAVIYGETQQRLGYVCVFRDITFEKQAEEEAIKTQKLESIGLLAGGIAHDFNNILSGILGNAQLARMIYEKKKSIEKYLTGIEEATQSAAMLTQQLLTFSKGGEPVKKLIDLKEILEEAVPFALRGSNVKSVFFIENELWAVNADRGQINQVINNLTINADHAMPGGGRLRIEARNVRIGEEITIAGLKPGNYIEIRFTDQGIGISEENLGRIFDPYFTTKQKGSGLGLASSYSIIDKHNGLITVQSVLGEGTTFTIYLPAQEGSLHSKKLKSEKIKAGSGSILVMDDEAYIRSMMEDMLTMLGYRPDVAADGEEAIRMYRAALKKGNPYRAVIMDLTIPGDIGGKEAIKKLIKIDPDVKSIVSSGYSADSIMANYGDFGFNGILQKPFKIEEISAMLEEVLTD